MRCRRGVGVRFKIELKGIRCALFSVSVNVVIFGATGMVGKGVLLECLDDPRVARMLLVSRRSIDVKQAKVREQLQTDFVVNLPIDRQIASWMTAVSSPSRLSCQHAFSNGHVGIDPNVLRCKDGFIAGPNESMDWVVDAWRDGGQNTRHRRAAQRRR
jgi:hypothetical protein